MIKRPISYLLLFALLFLAPAGSGAFLIEPGPSGEDPIDVIVLDPGHGGDDSGAVGPSGVTEKELALEVAKRLAPLLTERLGCKVLLTRTEDVFIPLEERTAFANMNKADLFISIHVNAARNRSAAGIETYFLDPEATDEDAMRVAEQENRVVVSGEKETEALTDDLKAILLDLAVNSTHHLSSTLAESLHINMIRMTRRGDRGVKQAPFHVLTGAMMPAVLMEIGFISNPAEERWLGTADAAGRIAHAIASGVAEFRGRTAGDEEGKGFRNAAVEER